MRARTKFLFSVTVLTASIAAFHWLPARDSILRQLWSFNQAHYQEFSEKVAARKLPSIDKRISFSSGDSLSPTPYAVPQGGIYPNPITVELHLADDQSCSIHYTLDGSIPTFRDRLYQGKPIGVDTFSVLRFRCLDQGMLPGEVRSETYITSKDSTGLPVISIVMDPVNLWNKHTGIYEHPLGRGRAWMREADLHFLRRGEPVVSLSGQLRIHGGYSRRVPKKSFRFSFSVPSQIALSEEHLLIRNHLGGENTVVIRAGGAAQGFRLRDALSGALYSKLGGQASAAEPVLLRLNGQTWGVYDIRERIDAGWLHKRFGPGDYELMGFDSKKPSQWGTPVLGNGKSWEKMIRFFEAHDLSDSQARQTVQAFIDTDNTLDYWLHNIFIANVDWPYNNFNAWRNATSNGMWRWISWDVDATFDHQARGLNHNTLEWSLRDRVRNDLKWNFEAGHYEDKESYLQSTLIMRRLLEVPEIRHRFVTRAHDLLNELYAPQKTLPILTEIANRLKTDRAIDFQRWGWSDSIYFADLARVSEFLKKRPEIVRGHLATRFGLGPAITIRIETQGLGRIRINSLTLSDSVWTGYYPRNMEIDLEAIPHSQGQFIGWHGLDSTLAAKPQIKLQMQDETVVRAIFSSKP